MNSGDIKSRMKARQPVHLVNPNYPSAGFAVKLSQLGFDAVFIDCEHGSYSIEQVASMSTAVSAAGGVPIVRPEANVDWLIARYINLGVRGICVPGLDSAAEAKHLVAAIRCTDAGCDGTVLTLGILESKAALENLDDICAVDGLDALMLGPVDLARSLGLRLPADRPQIDELVADTLGILRDRGRACGTRVTAGNRNALASSGCSVFYSHANDLIEAGAASVLKR